MNASLAEAFCHRREHWAGGIRLRPFSLAAWFALDAIGSPLINGEARDIADLLVAAKICASPDPRNARVVPTLAEKLLYGWRERDGVYLARELAAFRAYLDDYTAFPEFWRDMDAGEGRSLSAPPALVKVATLMRNGYTRDEAWHCPIGEAYFMAPTFNELDGAQLRFLDDDEEEAEPVPQLSEEELYAQAVRDLGQEGADAFFAVRREKAL